MLRTWRLGRGGNDDCLYVNASGFGAHIGALGVRDLDRSSPKTPNPKKKKIILYNKKYIVKIFDKNYNNC